MVDNLFIHCDILVLLSTGPLVKQSDLTEMYPENEMIYPCATGRSLGTNTVINNFMQYAVYDIK